MMKIIILANTVLLLASLTRASPIPAGSIPQCPEASLSFYDMSLPNGCLFGLPGVYPINENLWRDFSSPMTADPSLITVVPQCRGASGGGNACGFYVTGGTVGNIPNLDSQVVLGLAVPPSGVFQLSFCAGPTGVTAEGSAIFDPGSELHSFVSSPAEGCNSGKFLYHFGIGSTSAVQSWAEIDSGSGTVSYFVGVGPEPGTMILLGGGLTVLACLWRKLRPRA